MKKAIIAIITLILILTVFPITAAASTTYKPRLEAPTSDNPYYNSQLNRYSQTGYGMPNCVAYVYGRVYEMNDKAPLITRGNAGEWWGINKSGNYYKSGQEPKVGAVAVWSGHVAIVEEINKDGSFTVSESHYGGTYFDTTTITSSGNHYGQTFYGYIYTYEEKEVEKPKTYKLEQKVMTPENVSTFTIVKQIGTANDVKLVKNDKMLLSAI